MIDENQFVASLVEKIFSSRVQSVNRITKGITNRVYKVNCGASVFACRLNKSGRTLRSHELHSTRLNQLGVRTATVVYADYSGDKFGAPFQVLEWVNGEELDDVVANGSRGQVESFATAFAESIAKTQLWKGAGYGYMTSGDWTVSDSWFEVTRLSIQRGKESLGNTQGADQIVGALTLFAKKNSEELARVPARAYIDDWHHQNVFLTDQGLTGIDVDSIAFGDFRDLIGRSLWRFRDTPNGRRYVDHLLGHFPALANRGMVTFYAALFGCYAPDSANNSGARIKGLLELCSEFA